MNLFAVFKKNLTKAEQAEDIYTLENAKQMVLKDTKEKDILPFINKIKYYDENLYYHCFYVAIVSVKVCIVLGLNNKIIKEVSRGALIHDIGKIFLNEEVINAPRTLTKGERKVIEKHPFFGFRMIEDLDFGLIVEDIVLHHHENERGRGYPDGSTNMELETKIVSIVDKYDALVGERSYNKTFSKEEAIEELMKFKDNYTDGARIISALALAVGL